MREGSRTLLVAALLLREPPCSSCLRGEFQVWLNETSRRFLFRVSQGETISLLVPCAGGSHAAGPDRLSTDLYPSRQRPPADACGGCLRRRAQLRPHVARRVFLSCCCSNPGLCGMRPDPGISARSGTGSPPRQ